MELRLGTMGKAREGPAVRPFRRGDIGPLVSIYRKAFREPPWNEDWKPEEVRKDLEFAISQAKPVILVLERERRIRGFTWGYSLPMEKFPFLEGAVEGNAIYMDEIAVDPRARRQGIGKALCMSFLIASGLAGFEQAVLRTDQRNEASMSLFGSVGFSNMGICDPEYPSRLYLRKRLEDAIRF
ncbi:MAG TPA: GNAT family N-acetyltransferase [Candidatus Saccharimonadales bacterium]|nr:GNAT family N-acetyltransferase [Candidatus Saccharimonadales bacterium]